MFLQIFFTQKYLKIQEISKTVHFQKLYELLDDISQGHSDVSVVSYEHIQ